jgi:Uma2 family endonuclease
LARARVWLIYPDERLLEVYTADGDVRLLTGDAILEGGDLLPGFQVAIARLWA